MAVTTLADSKTPGSWSRRRTHSFRAVILILIVMNFNPCHRKHICIAFHLQLSHHRYIKIQNNLWVLQKFTIMIPFPSKIRRELNIFTADFQMSIWLTCLFPILDMARYMTEWEKNVFDVFDVFRIWHFLLPKFWSGPYLAYLRIWDFFKILKWPVFSVFNVFTYLRFFPQDFKVARF